MLSINQKKLIRSLQQKKQRDDHGLFLLEGQKIISDLFASGELNINNLVLLTAINSWKISHADEVKVFENLFFETSPEEISKLSSMVTAPPVMALVRKPEVEFQPAILKEDISLFLESIRDPGNLGTILRTADWFGIKNIICSPDCVDCYNPKVVQSSMGAIMRVRTHYIESVEFLEIASRFKIPVYGTTMDGGNLYDIPVRSPGIIVFGNESTGISAGLDKYFREKIRIPAYPSDNSGSESLNVATSMAVLIGELRRRMRE